MDTVEPPRIVFESAAECADRDRAESALRQSLAQARATGWVITVRVQPAGLPAVSADGEVSDETGARRAHQVTSGTVTDCTGLASAMGAWASMVLASEAQHAEPTGPGQEAPATSPALPPIQPLPAPVATAPTSPSPALAPASRAPPSDIARVREWPPAPPPPVVEERAPLELGVGTFLMAGGASGGYAGVAPFLVGDIGQGVFLRPSIALGGSVATDLPSTWAAARLDTCVRLPGRYATRGGLQLDLCGGADVGFSYVSSGTSAGTPPSGQTLPYVDLGPSVDLRAEVGRFAATLRGVGGIDVTRDGFVDVTGARVDTTTWSWRLELDVSWVFRNDEIQPLMARQTAQ